MANNKRKRKYVEDYINFGFTSIISAGKEKPQCVVCSEVLSEESMKPNKLRRHLESKHPKLKNKSPEFFKSKSVQLKKSRLDSDGIFERQSKAGLMASYVVSLRIAKAKKPYVIGEELILPCAKDIVHHVLGDKAAKSLESISLSNNTVQRRIADMSADILSQVIEEIKQSPLDLFTLQVDESTDVSNLPQLLVYVRYIHNGDFKDEFLFCRPLETTTKSIDVFEKIGSFLKEHGLKWENVGGICTDGAPSMLGCKSGFQQLVKKVSPQAIGVHCMIHRQVLASKTLPIALKIVMQSVVKAVNFIKSNALNNRLFAKLCQEMDSKHEVLLLHTEVRWLSKGKVLQRFFELNTEVREFLSQQGKTELSDFFGDVNNLAKTAYLVDFFTILNSLNLSLQGENSNILDFVEKLTAFQMKLDLWLARIKKRNFYMFPTLNAFVEENETDVSFNNCFQSLLIQHLETLKEEFCRYFPEEPQLSQALLRKPFAAKVENVPERYQEEFIDLITSGCANTEFDSLTVSQFWIKQLFQYPNLAEAMIRIIMPFPSTYMCEVTFSSLLLIKSKLRSKLHAEDDLRCAVSKTSPQIEKLVMGKQYQPSH